MKVYEITVGNIHIFYGYITENDTDNRDDILSLYRQKKVANIRNIKNKRLSILAEMLLLYGMDKLNIKCNYPLEFTNNEFGKPYITGMENFYFNLSHSGDMAVCAISDTPVGVDVEKITRDCGVAIDRYFLPSEIEISKGRGTSYIWTRKEAVAKANGRGIGVGIDKIDTSGDIITLDGEEYRLFTNRVARYYISCACRLVSP